MPSSDNFMNQVKYKNKNNDDKRIPNDFDNKRQNNNNLNENNNNIINMKINNSVNMQKPPYNFSSISAVNLNNIKNYNTNKDNGNEFKRSKKNGFPVSNSMMINSKSPNINLEDNNS